MGQLLRTHYELFLGPQIAANRNWRFPHALPNTPQARAVSRAARGGDAADALTTAGPVLARPAPSTVAMLALTWLKQRVRGLHGVPESDAESDAQCDATLSGRHTDRVRTVPHTLVQAVQVGVGMCITTLRRLSFRSAATDLSQSLSGVGRLRTYSTNLAGHKDESDSSLQLLRCS